MVKNTLYEKTGGGGDGRAFQKKDRFNRPEIWPANGAGSGGKFWEPDGVVMSLRLWQGSHSKVLPLRSGHTKSCGCQNNASASGNALGLTYVDGTCVEMLRARTVRRNNTSGVPVVDW